MNITEWIECKYIKKKKNGLVLRHFNALKCILNNTSASYTI